MFVRNWIKLGSSVFQGTVGFVLYACFLLRVLLTCDFLLFVCTFVCVCVVYVCVACVL